MEERLEAGYRELEHTADWELQVWAPDLSQLFVLAAQGMYALAGTRLQGQERIIRKLDLSANDIESLLVMFLNDLLFLSEEEGLAFDRFDVETDGGYLHADVYGAPISNQDKEIKAVTFHNLELRNKDGLFSINIVFDV